MGIKLHEGTWTVGFLFCLWAMCLWVSKQNKEAVIALHSSHVLKPNQTRSWVKHLRPTLHEFDEGK